MRSAILKKLVFYCLLLPLPVCLLAQPDDTQLRQSIGIDWKINKRWEANASYRMDLFQNLGTFRRSNVTVGGTYEIRKWLNASVSYRFGTSYSKDFHRFRAGLAAKKDIYRDLQGGLRTMMQHDVRYLDADYLSDYKPTYIWRNKISLKYPLSKRIDVGIYTDLFTSLKQGVLNPYRLRSGFSVSYLYKKRHHLSAEYFYQNEFRTKSPLSVQVFNLDYTFDLQKKKKKKKKTTGE